jgi:hypothetical protein
VWLVGFVLVDTQWLRTVIHATAGAVQGPSRRPVAAGALPDLQEAACEGGAAGAEAGLSSLV